MKTLQYTDLKSILINAHRLGLDLPELLVLCSFSSHSLAGEGEPSTHISSAEVAAETGLNYTRVVRAIKKLNDASLIGREQRAKEKGVTATTTLMPQAFELLNANDVSPRIPVELARLLCGQPEDAIAPVISAWTNHSQLPAEALPHLRGTHHDQIEAILSERAKNEAQAMYEALESAMEEECLKEQGIEVIQTSDGPVHVNTIVFTKNAPGDVHWSFVKSVLERLYEKAPLMLTRANLHMRIAEAAYARNALPFVREKPFMDGVRLLAHQMRVSWSKPHRISAAWYWGANEAINTCSHLHH